MVVAAVVARVGGQQSASAFWSSAHMDGSRDWYMAKKLASSHEVSELEEGRINLGFVRPPGQNEHGPAATVVVGATVVDGGGITGPIPMMGKEKLRLGMDMLMLMLMLMDMLPSITWRCRCPRSSGRPR